jgi:hypothetical protein
MEISNNIIAIVTDSAEPNNVMCKRFEQRGLKSRSQGLNPQTKSVSPFRAAEGWVRCMCHAINRCTQKILTQLKVAIPKEREELYDDTTFESTPNHSSSFGKMRRIIAKTRRSDPLKAALSRMCHAQKVAVFKLALDMEIRWNSTSVMLKIFLSMEPAIRALFTTTEAKEGGMQHLQLTEGEWAYLHRLDLVFEAFHPLIRKLSAQSYPHAYNVLPSYVMLSGQLRAFIRKYEDDDPLLVAAISQGEEVLKKYLDRSKLTSTSVICVLLNPKMKMKKLEEIGWTREERKHDRSLFVNVYEEYCTRFNPPETSTLPEEYDDDISEDELAWDTEIHKDPSPEPKAPVSFGTEVDRWLAAPLQPKSDKTSYCDYWKGMSTVYPILSRMARDYGCILASSVPSESVFSMAGLQMRKNRMRLAPKTMGIIMCLRSWGCLPEQEDDTDEDDGTIQDLRKDWAFGNIEGDIVEPQSQQRGVFDDDFNTEYPDIDDLLDDLSS